MALAISSVQPIAMHAQPSQNNPVVPTVDAALQDKKVIQSPNTTVATNTNNKKSVSFHLVKEVGSCEPTVHVQEVIPLPDLVEVKTCTENEVTLFQHRVELQRYVNENDQWSLGVGIMKVNIHKHDTRYIRFYMERESHKSSTICDHLIQKYQPFYIESNEIMWVNLDSSCLEAWQYNYSQIFRTIFVTKSDCALFMKRIHFLRKNIMDDGEPDMSTLGVWFCDVCYCCMNKYKDEIRIMCKSKRDELCTLEQTTHLR